MGFVKLYVEGAESEDDSGLGEREEHHVETKDDSECPKGEKWNHKVPVWLKDCDNINITGLY